MLRFRLELNVLGGDRMGVLASLAETLREIADLLEEGELDPRHGVDLPLQDAMAADGHLVFTGTPRLPDA